MKNLPNPIGKIDTPEMCPDLNLVAEALNLPNGGFSLPDYEGEIAKSEVVKEIDCKYGTIEKKLITMDDGTYYDLIKGVPYDQRSNTLAATTTAWWLHAELEHNRKTVRSVLRSGHPVVLAGQPKGFSASDVSLSKATYDLHRMLDEEAPDMNVDPNLAIILGASRAAMVGIGMSVEKYARGREIPYADVTAPCVPRQFKLSEWPKVVGQLGKEALSITDTATEYGMSGELLSYIKNILPNDPSHVYNALRIFPGLIRGEAGVLADESNPNTVIHIDQFRDDFWALRPEWDKKFAGRNNVKIVDKDGSHISGIAQKKTRRDISARLQALAELRGYDGEFVQEEIIENVLPIESTEYPSRLHIVPNVRLPFMKAA